MNCRKEEKKQPMVKPSSYQIYRNANEINEFPSTSKISGISGYFPVKSLTQKQVAEKLYSLVYLPPFPTSHQ